MFNDHAAMAIANAKLFESLQRELEQRAAAEEQAKTFVALIENSTDMIAMADFEGRVLFVNAAGRALVGIPPDYDVRDDDARRFPHERRAARARRRSATTAAGRARACCAISRPAS